MTRILVVSELYWPEGRGGVLATHLIVKLLKSLGFSITVIHGARSPEAVGGVEYVYSDLLSVRDKFRLWFNCLRLGRSGWFLRLLRGHDVLYVPRYCYPLIPVAKRLGKRVVVHLHDYQPISYNASVPAPYEAYRGKLVEWILEVERSKGLKNFVAASLSFWIPKLVQVWMADADFIVCASKRQCEIIGMTNSLKGGETFVVYNPIPLENFVGVRKNLDDVPAFLYVGGEEYIKGFRLLLKAIAMLKHKGVKLRLRFTGHYSAGSLGILRGLEDGKVRIEVYGRVPYSQLRALHESSWGLVFPSIWEEPLPYAVVESMVSGTIPIASRVGGVPEIVGGTYAERFLFRPGDVEGFVGRIEEVASMRREDVQDIGARLREEALRRFDMDKVKEQLLSIFG